MKLLTLMMLSIFLAATWANGAKTIFVPRDYADIQHAINAAHSGDTVRIAPGNYSGFRMKQGVRVVGEERDTTIISNTGVLFYYIHGATLENLTIRNACVCDDPYSYCGSILLLESDGIVISNCVIKKNNVSRDYSGAICVCASDVSILGCILEENTGEFAGGICCCFSSNLFMQDTVVRANKSTLDSFPGSAGGIYSEDSSVEVVNCIFENNETPRRWGGSAIHFFGDGSLFIEGCRFAGNKGQLEMPPYAVKVGLPELGFISSVKIKDSIFENNEKYDLEIWEIDGRVEISKCLFRNTLIDDEGVRVIHADPVITNCLFDGTGIYLYDDDIRSVITNCTFVNCYHGVSGLFIDEEITNCIFWDNDIDLYDLYEPKVTYSCIEDGYPGEGNISDNPEFADPGNGDYRLTPGSPCMDTGNNNAPEIGEKDLEGKPRILPTHVDMGCYEYPSSLPSVVITDIYEEYEHDGTRVVRAVFRIYTSDSSDVHLAAEYSIDDGNYWEEASGSYSSAAPFATSPEGTEYEFYWDSITDLGICIHDGVLLSVSTLIGGDPGVSEPFDLNTFGEVIHDRSSFTFNAAGDFIAPSETQLLHIRNAYVNSIGWSITGVPEWLDVTPDSGEVDSDGVSIEITALPGSLSTGTYTADLTLNSAEAFNTPQTIEAILNVGIERIVTPDGPLGIQETIDISNPGDVVKVMPGKYEETVVMAPDVSVIGTDMDTTTIIGDGENPVITAEGIGSVVLRDLTLMRGWLGLSCEESFIVIEKCCSRYNYYSGFAFYRYSESSLKNCVGTNNGSAGLDLNSQSKVTAENCLFANNGYAGVQSISSPSTLINCTVANNGEYGILSSLVDLSVTNCIVYGNGDDLDGCEATYSCIGDGDAGTGNISDNPSFVEPHYMNYHITANSPCRDAGTPDGAPADDFEGDPRSGNPDMGYDEFVDTDGDSMQNAWEKANGLNPEDSSDKYDDPDWDYKPNFFEYILGSDPMDLMSPRGTVYVDSSAAPGGDGTETNPFQKIQEGIDAAWYGDNVIVAPGNYAESLVMKQAVHLQGDIRDFPLPIYLPLINADGSDGIICMGLTSGRIEGLEFTNCSDGISTIGASIDANHCIIKGGSFSGAVSFYTSVPCLTNLLCLENDVSGVDVLSSANTQIANCTVVNNGTFGIYAFFGIADVTNSILWNNEDDLSGCFATYSDIEDGDVGTGNISQEPLFVSGPFGEHYLSQIAAGQAQDSPCVDAGSETAENLGFDNMVTRTDGFPDSDIVDMGYHYPHFLRIYSMVLEGNSVTLIWNEKAGRSYIVQWSTDMETWNDVPVGEVGNWTDPDISGATKKYYRIFEQ